MFDKNDHNKMMAIRGSVLVFIVILLVYSQQSGCTLELKDGECMRDLPFEWTEAYNKPLRENYAETKKIDKNAIAWSDWWLIFQGFEIDFLQIGTNVALLTCERKSYRILITFTLFYLVRGILQENFLLSRLEGFLWWYPGWPAITNPYHDILDFFYSGHIGNTFIHTWEFHQNGQTNISAIGVLIWLSMWPLLILVRTHFWIDLTTGLIVGHWSCMMGEWLSYPVDVKIMGFAGKERKQHAYNPCYKCGYSNENYATGIHQEEKKFLFETYKIRKNAKSNKGK